jgi:hypothetical protein
MKVFQATVSGGAAPAAPRIRLLQGSALWRASRNPVLQRSEPSGAPDPARETLSVLFVSKRHGEPPNTALQSSKPKGAPDPARETLSVLLDSGSTAVPRTRLYEDTIHWGAEPRRLFRAAHAGSCARDWRGAQRPRSGGTPAKPGRRSRMRPN